ncbi:hypothetical protein [Butyrivibrio sp. JL13D10]|uniref:hypothetical protein n=1 Tax=Butyrivibrio sp. JL13D10 TaxID=3236815 RepID=UPI0038B4A26C
MVKRVVKALITCFVAGFFLTGCGSQFPEMSQDQHDQTVHYMVSLLMKYSNNGVEKLSSLSSLELERQMKKEAREKAKAERDALNAEDVANLKEDLEQSDGDNSDTNNDSKSEETPEEKLDENSEQTGNDNSEADTSSEQAVNETTVDAPNTDGSSVDTQIEDDIDELLDKYEDELNEGLKNTESEIAESNPGQDSSVEETPTMPSADGETTAAEPDKIVDGMRQELSKGMFLTYSGYSVAGTYPDNDDIFVITATSGKKLLILNFRLANTSGMDVTVDMVKANPHFQIVLNGVNIGYTNVTMLENDLSSYSGTITSGEKKSMVLIKQMDASKLKNVESLALIGDMGGETIEFKLE